MTARTILVDLRCCQFNGDRGIPAYAQSLALELVRSPGHRWLLLQDPRRPPPARAAELAACAEWCTPADLDRSRSPAIDVLLTGCFFLPRHDCGADYLWPAWLRRRQPRRLGIVYDLVPLLFPERYLSRPGARRQYLDALHVLRQSDHLFAISGATRRDTIRHAAVDPLRISVIHGDIDHAKRTAMGRPAAASADVPGRHGLTGPYCVCVGGGDWRKNMEATVRAFAIFRRGHPRHRLAIVCRLQPARIAELLHLAVTVGLPPDAVVCTGHVSDDDMVGLVRHADLLVYPSLYEGLGLPVLEAYGCGTPVVGSATSSVAELVIPELACDPADPAAIAAAMDRLATSREVRERSLAFGRGLLADVFGWARAAEAVLEHVSGHRAPAAVPAAVTRPRLAVVGALPPARTGIAPYTLRHLQDDRWRTTFYEANEAPRLVTPRRLLPGNEVRPAELLPAAVMRGRHDAVLFVLGNSGHHVKVLDAMMRSRGGPARRLAWLHEAVLDSLFEAWLGRDADRLPAPSPAAAAAAWIGRSLSARPALGCCLRLLVERGELDGFVVNSSACRDLVRTALGSLADGLSIDVAFLPIDSGAASPAPAATGPSAGGAELLVGTFGLAGDTKRLDVLARAVILLRRRRPARLLIAGWEARAYCRRTGIDAMAGVEVVDAPDDRSLVEAMRQVDVAVQLRTPTFGESSGVVNQLLAVGTPLVVSDEGSFGELPGETATFVAAGCRPSELATAIEAAAGRRLTADQRAAILAARSPRAFAERLAGIIATRPARPDVGLVA